MNPMTGPTVSGERFWRLWMLNLASTVYCLKMLEEYTDVCQASGTFWLNGVVLSLRMLIEIKMRQLCAIRFRSPLAKFPWAWPLPKHLAFAEVFGPWSSVPWFCGTESDSKNWEYQPQPLISTLETCWLCRAASLTVNPCACEVQ